MIKDTATHIRALSWKQRILYTVVVIGVVGGIGFFCGQYHTTDYYTSVTEIYGIPTGVGEPLSSHDRKELAAYWKLEEYPFRSQMVLSYEDSYHQIELMKQYSTAYSMTFFQPSARIVYCYEKDKDRFSEEEKEAESAKSIHFRSIISTSYYSSDGKLLLKLEKSGKNQFEITAYSAEDTPQLLN